MAYDNKTGACIGCVVKGKCYRNEWPACNMANSRAAAMTDFAIGTPEGLTATLATMWEYIPPEEWPGAD